MGYIFYVMGKSAAGKDTIYKELVRRFPEYGTVRMYTTRPIRDGEQEGVEYYFTDEARLKKLESQGKVIECRTYDTVFGPWSYFTADDGQIDLKQGNYLMIGTLDSYEKMVNYYGNEVMIPLYIYVDDGTRLQRALDREKTQNTPKYAEMCRRFLADQDDFSEEKLEQAGIERRFCNVEFETCVEEICRFIVSDQNGERVYRER